MNILISLLILGFYVMDLFSLYYINFKKTSKTRIIFYLLFIFIFVPIVNLIDIYLIILYNPLTYLWVFIVLILGFSLSIVNFYSVFYLYLKNRLLIRITIIFFFLSSIFLFNIQLKIVRSFNRTQYMDRCILQKNNVTIKNDAALKGLQNAAIVKEEKYIPNNFNNHVYTLSEYKAGKQKKNNNYLFYAINYSTINSFNLLKFMRISDTSNIEDILNYSNTSLSLLTQSGPIPVFMGDLPLNNDTIDNFDKLSRIDIFKDRGPGYYNFIQHENYLDYVQYCLILLIIPLISGSLTKLYDKPIEVNKYNPSMTFVVWRD